MWILGLKGLGVMTVFSNTNLIATRHIKREKASLLVDVRR